MKQQWHSHQLDVIYFQTSDNQPVHESWTAVSGKYHQAGSGVPLWEVFLIRCYSFSNIQQPVSTWMTDSIIPKTTQIRSGVPLWEVLMDVILFQTSNTYTVHEYHVRISCCVIVVLCGCVVVLLCCCVVVLLCCCNVHLTKMCQNGTQEKSKSCILLVVIQKEEHPQWHLHLTKTCPNGTQEQWETHSVLYLLLLLMWRHCSLACTFDQDVNMGTVGNMLWP